MSVSRREVLQGAGALAVLAAPSPVLASVPPAGPRPAILSLFDSAMTQSRVFAAQARALGLDPVDSAGDVSAFALRCLGAIRSEMPVIAGLTPNCQLFALRMVVERPGYALVHAAVPQDDEAAAALALLAAQWPDRQGAVSLAGASQAIADQTPVAWLIAPRTLPKGLA